MALVELSSVKQEPNTFPPLVGENDKFWRTVSHIVLIIRPPYAPDILSRLVDEIVRPLRAVRGEQI
jgi:hypothetical protein